MGAQAAQLERALSAGGGGGDLLMNERKLGNQLQTVTSKQGWLSQQGIAKLWESVWICI
jgi:hypothetical protein